MAFKSYPNDQLFIFAGVAISLVTFISFQLLQAMAYSVFHGLGTSSKILVSRGVFSLNF